MNPTEDKTKGLPEIRFLHERKKIEVDETTSISEFVQIIQRGKVLVSRPVEKATATEKASGQEKSPQFQLIAGDNVELSPDGRLLTSTITGFPHISIKKNGNKNHLRVEVTPLIWVSEDKMQVLLNLFPSVEGERRISKSDIDEELDEQRILSPIDEQLIEESLTTLHEMNKPMKDILIARGMLPVNGDNAFLRFEKEIGPIAGNVLGDGSIDFRDRRLFIGVDEGELIATKIPATAGSPGINVYKEKISQKEGIDINVKVLDDAVFSQEKLEVRAAKAGILSVVNENNIKVSAKQIISGDVDYSTGHIKSNDSVEIRGSVLPDFRVKTKGDVYVSGNVQAASIMSRGNTVISGGIVGKKSRIRARGDIDINFVEGGRVTAGGTIVIRKQAYYCRLSAVGDIRCHERSRIVGGILACSGSFSGGDIGAPNAKPAVIAVGVDRKQYKKYLKIRKKMRELKKRKLVNEARCGTKDKKSGKFVTLETELDELQNALSQFDLATDLSPLLPDNSCNIEHAVEIVIHGEVFAGTRLRIGNLTRILDKDYSKVKCIWDRTLDDIAIRSL